MKEQRALLPFSSLPGLGTSGTSRKWAPVMTGRTGPIAHSGELPEKRSSASELLEQEHRGWSRQHNHDDFADQNCDVRQESRYAFLFRS